MTLKTLRKILAVIFAAIIAVSASVFAVSQVVHFTLCSENYLSKFFASEKITQQCRDNFNKRIEALEAKSGIPARVFDAVYNFSEITEDTAVHRLFAGHDTSLYNEATVDRFESLCTEYLDGNEIKYDKKLIRNTAEEAARIYADSFGIDNTDEAVKFIKQADIKYGRYSSVSFMLVVLSILMMAVLFSKPYDVFLRVFAAFTAQGFALALTGAVALIMKFGQHPLLSPQMYANAAIGAVKGMYVIMLLLGVLVGIGFLIANIVMTEKIKND